MVTSFPRDPASPHGGVEAVSVSLARALAGRSDLELHVVTVDGRTPALEVISWGGATVHRLPGSWRNLLTYAVGAGRRQVSAYLNDLEPDVVHAHDTYGIMVKGLPLPRLFTVHGFIYEDTRYTGGLKARLRSELWRRVETAGWADQPHIVAISPYVRERLRGIARGGIHDIENPVDETLFQLPREASSRVIFSAAAICPRKNTLGLVRSVELLARDGLAVELRLAGSATDPAYAEVVQAYARNHGTVGSVTFLGPISSGAVRV